jgi:hypothetical protein
VKDELLSELLNLNKASDEEIGQLEYVVNSPAWARFFKPYLFKMLNSINRMWRDRSAERRDKYSDDYLAAYAASIEGLLQWGDTLVKQTQAARVIDAQERTPEQEYDALRAMGFIKHAGQHITPEELAQAEDF